MSRVYCSIMHFKALQMNICFVAVLTNT